MTKILIIHFSPIELYPPIQNLLRELSLVSSTEIQVLTTHVVNQDLSEYHSPSAKIHVLRTGKIDRAQRSFLRYFNYCLFFFRAFLILLKSRPKAIFYYETLSSFPVVLYRIFNRHAKIFVHYHEYTSPKEYEQGMKLSSFFHSLEKRKIYETAEWISHTNNQRLQLFQEDIFPVLIKEPRVVPNYPPREWSSSPRPVHKPVRVVYIGALGLSTMFIKEFSNWINNQNGAVVWDIYCHTWTTDVERFFEEFACPWIKKYSGTNYESLPCILHEYDIGVILYNGHIPNYIYNAPNKLFEYLACGLDVWFPDILLTSKELATQATYPKVIPLNFENLTEFKWEEAVDRNGLKNQSSGFFSDLALKELIKRLLTA